MGLLLVLRALFFVFILLLRAGEFSGLAGETFRKPAVLGEVDREGPVCELFALDVLCTQGLGVATGTGRVVAEVVNKMCWEDSGGGYTPLCDPAVGGDDSLPGNVSVMERVRFCSPGWREMLQDLADLSSKSSAGSTRALAGLDHTVDIALSCAVVSRVLKG